MYLAPRAQQEEGQAEAHMPTAADVAWVAPVLANAPGTLDEDMATAFSQAEELREQMQQNTSYSLTPADRIALLDMYVSKGVRNAQQMAGKDAIVVIGNTGAGKSTLLNYLIGCRMARITRREAIELGIRVRNAVEEVVVVSEDSPQPEVMRIGHENVSEMFLPEIVYDSGNRVAYCDCPGFFDTRSAEVNVANAANIQSVLKYAKSVRLLILLDYHKLLSDKGKGVSELLTMCEQLFGSSDRLVAHKEGLLLGVTQVPPSLSLARIRGDLEENTPAIMRMLSERVFLYDPINAGGQDFLQLRALRQRIHALQPIHPSANLFHTVLTHGDQYELREIVEAQSKILLGHVSGGDYVAAAACWQVLQRLCVISHSAVKRSLDGVQGCLVDAFTQLEFSFREACHNHRFEQAQESLSLLTQILSAFSAAISVLDLPELFELQACYDKALKSHRKHNALRARCQELFQAHEAMREQYDTDQLRNATEHQRLLDSLAEQQRVAIEAQDALRSAHGKREQALRDELANSRGMHKSYVAQLEQERDALLRKKDEDMAQAQQSASDEYRVLRREKEKLELEYEEKLNQALSEQKNTERNYEEILSDQAARFQAKIQELEQQAAVGAQQLDIARIPLMAFGAREWQKYFGYVGNEPELSANIDTLLAEGCPFWPDRKIEDTHLLFLMPEQIDGQPFTLNLLSALIQNPRVGGHSVRYRRYGPGTRKQLGDQPSGASYWVLLTRDILPGSQNKTYEVQEAWMCEPDAARAGYALPRVLEAATGALLHYVRSAGGRLYADNPSVFTRCSERISGYDDELYAVVVGDFSSDGLVIRTNNSKSDRLGVAGCRRCKSP